ncbi:Pex19 protein family-domain-containing protein [Terfezia claveryi]|nr:Pex19 protein family-domain-containing protein [Terfezia claveryi]
MWGWVDLLDEFTEAAKPVPGSSGPNLGGIPGAGAGAGAGAVPGRGVGGEDVDDEFAQELQRGMADLLGELESSPELQQQFETLVKELSDAAATEPPPASATPGTATAAAAASPSSATSAAEGTSFADTINRTMNRLQDSSTTIQSEVASSEDDFLSDMLKQMGSMSGLGDSEEDFSKMLLNMMEQLTSKDILYEPMRELAEKYPAWLEKNEREEKYSLEEMRRYREQFGYVRNIVARFENEGYRDSSTSDREYIVENMQKMQAAGSPPAELMGGMSEGLEIPPDMEGSCPMQ